MSTPQQTSSQPLLHEENARLQRAVHELSILNDLALAIGGLQNSMEIIQRIVHRSLKAVAAEQGVITLAENQETTDMRTLVRTMGGRDAGTRFHLDQQLLGWMHLHKQALLIDSPATDERFQSVEWDPSIRTVLCVPLMVKSSLRGVLTVYNKAGNARFTSDDQRLLAIIASQSAQILENARLVESEKTLQRMQEDLNVAARIQQNLLPQSPPEIAGYEIAGTSASDWPSVMSPARDYLHRCLWQMFRQHFEDRRSGSRAPGSVSSAQTASSISALPVIDSSRCSLRSLMCMRIL
jgi:sigma-B regulation protein RsbU (phosphoserine phosphatase)